MITYYIFFIIFFSYNDYNNTICLILSYIIVYYNYSYLYFIYI